MQALDAIDAPTLDYQAWRALPERNTPFEVVDGRPIVSPSPYGPHQLVVSRLLRLLSPRIPHGYEILSSPVDWILHRDPLLVRQPDLAVVTDQQARHVPLTAPPLLAAEVVSPHGRETDLVTKRREYARAELAWYWIVDPDRPQIVALHNRNGEFVRAGGGAGDETLELDAPFAIRLRLGELID